MVQAIRAVIKNLLEWGIDRVDRALPIAVMSYAVGETRDWLLRCSHIVVEVVSALAQVQY